MENEEIKEYEVPAEENQVEDPLPNGSYFEHKARMEEAERQRRRMRFPYPVLVTAAFRWTAVPSAWTSAHRMVKLV